MVGIELGRRQNRPKRPFDPASRIGAAVCAKIRNRGVPAAGPLGDVLGC